MSKMIKVAQIINTRGLKGDCKMNMFTDEGPERFSRGVVLFLDEEGSKPIHPISYSEYKGFGYARFEEVPSINEAELLKGKNVYIREEDLPETEDDEFYYSDLYGLKAFDTEGNELGLVSDILETGAPYPVLRISQSEESFMVPFNEAFIEEVDLDEETITIRMMEGLR